MGKWKNKTKKSAGLRGLVINAHGTDCYVCGEPCLYGKKHADDPNYLTLDHVHAKVLGGSDHLENLKPAHYKCNQFLGRLTQEQIISGEADWSL